MLFKASPLILLIDQLFKLSSGPKLRTYKYVMIFYVVMLRVFVISGFYTCGRNSFRSLRW